MANRSHNSTFCPLLEKMRDQDLKNNVQVNMVVVCFHGLVSCLGIFENALIIWVVGFRLRHRTVASVWVLNLAMSDFLATLTLPLFTAYLHNSHSWELGQPLCKAQTSIFFLNMFVSAYLLAAISLDRLFLVTKPVWSQNHRSVAGAWKICILGWLWAIVNTIPYFVFRSVTNKKHNGRLCYHNFAFYVTSDETLERDCIVRQTATAISKLLLTFLVPLVVIAGSYMKIAHNLRKRTIRRRQSTAGPTDILIMPDRNGESKTTKSLKTPKDKFPLKLLNPKEKVSSLTTPNQTNPSQLSQSFTKMVTSVIAAFALCWAPYHIFCMIEVAAQYQGTLMKHVVVGLPLATTFAFLNPVLNPILYVFSCPHFCVRIRQSLGAVFDGLLEERGFMMVPGQSIRHPMFRKSSRDVSISIPGSRKGSSSLHPTPNIECILPSPLLSGDLKDG
ncbi:prostaglandin D2 receptor 2-like isoform 2-T2 [Pholidichthys leucotaenia]